MATQVENKRNPVKSTESGNAKGAPKKGKNEGQQKLTIVKPMLPGGYERMLRRQGADAHLDHIQVSFYPRGIHEIKFAVRNPETDEVLVLQPGGYQVFRNKLEPELNRHKEEEAAEQFFRKLESRCWVKCSDYTPANARRVKALAWPTPIESAFRLTQKDIKSKKLTPTRMFSIWKERNEAERAIISKFQKEVDPAYDWVETLSAYSLFMERTKREEEAKKKEKIKKDEVVLPDQKWGDIEDAFGGNDPLPLGEVPLTSFHDGLSDPFKDVGEEEEEEDPKDPLDRAISPKPREPLSEKTKEAQSRSGKRIDNLLTGLGVRAKKEESSAKAEEVG